MQNLTVYLTAAFNQFFNPWAIQAISWKYYLVYCGWLIIELVFVVTYLVETKGDILITISEFILMFPRNIGRTLEETAALFDGEQQPQDLVQLGGEAATMTMSRGHGLILPVQQQSQKEEVELQLNIRTSYHPEYEIGMAS